MRVSCEVELPNLVVPALPAAAPRAVRPTPAKTTEISRNERRALITPQLHSAICLSQPHSLLSHNPQPASDDTPRSVVVTVVTATELVATLSTTDVVTVMGALSEVVQTSGSELVGTGTSKNEVSVADANSVADATAVVDVNAVAFLAPVAPGSSTVSTSSPLR